MTKLTTAARKRLPKKDFAGPEKSFPLEDKVHDREAISGATRGARAGNISEREADKIKSEARAKLGEGSPKGRSSAEGEGKNGKADTKTAPKRASVNKLDAKRPNGRDAAKLGKADQGRSAARMNVGGWDHDDSMRGMDHDKPVHTSKDR